MTGPPENADAFRRGSTLAYRAFVVFMAVVAIGIAFVGWWLGRWWGLLGGVAIGTAVLGGGLVAGTLVWAMTQDGA